MDTTKSASDPGFRHAAPLSEDGGRPPGETLEARIFLLLGWEKRKRREVTFIVALFYAFLAALAGPLFVSLPLRWSWVIPAGIAALVAPWLLFTRRWRDADTTRALAALDRRLHLDERATTAWELSRRNDTRAVALLVLREANERLRRFDPRALFPRSWDWHAWLLPPLFALWIAMLYFDARFDLHVAAPRPASPLARELQEFARQLQQKAQNEALPETLKAARDLERVAQGGIEAGTGDEAFKSDLAAARRRLAAQRSGLGQAPPAASASRRELADLRTDLEAARDSFSGSDAEAQGWQERLAGLSQLKKQLEQLQQGDARELSRGELKALVDKLEQQVTAELDRRALIETEEFLKSLPQREEGERRGAKGFADRNEERDNLAQRGEDMPGTSPGDARGEKGGKAPAPELQGAGRAEVKGPVGEGERSATFFKAKPVPGKSRLSQEELVSSYRRQAEAELGTERIPDALKETIRNYFLSLETTK